MVHNDVVATIDIRRIMQHLPHRFPFLLIDRILALDLGQTIRALKNVTYNEPFFTGHFAEYPVMPGVLIIEAMAQAAGLLEIESAGSREKNELYFFVGIDKARFRRQVVPGDQLIIEARIIQAKHKIGKYAARAWVDELLVCEAEVMCTRHKVTQ